MTSFFLWWPLSCWNSTQQRVLIKYVRLRDLYVDLSAVMVWALTGNPWRCVHHHYSKTHSPSRWRQRQIGQWISGSWRLSDVGTVRGTSHSLCTSLHSTPYRSHYCRPSTTFPYKTHVKMQTHTHTHTHTYRDQRRECICVCIYMMLWVHYISFTASSVSVCFCVCMSELAFLFDYEQFRAWKFMCFYKFTPIHAWRVYLSVCSTVTVMIACLQKVVCVCVSVY